MIRVGVPCLSTTIRVAYQANDSPTTRIVVPYTDDDRGAVAVGGVVAWWIGWGLTRAHLDRQTDQGACNVG